MSYQPKLTKEELRVIKDALVEYTTLNEDGMDAYYYPKDREIAIALRRRLDMAYVWSESGASNYSKEK